MLSFAYEKKGLYLDQINCLKKALKLNKQAAFSLQVKLVEVYLNLAENGLPIYSQINKSLGLSAESRSYDYSGLYTLEAQKYIYNLHTTYPKHQKVWELKIKSLLLDGNTTDIVSSIQESKKHNPHLSKDLNRHLCVWSSKTGYTKFIYESCQRALHENKRDEKLYLGYWDWLNSQNDTLKRKNFLNKALIIFPKSTKWLDIAYHSTNLNYTELQKKKWLERWISLDPNYTSYYKKALYLFKSKDYKKALTYFEKACHKIKRPPQEFLHDFQKSMNDLRLKQNSISKNYYKSWNECKVLKSDITYKDRLAQEETSL